jgi:hypothetical protein
MKIFLIIFFTSLIVVALVFLLNFASFNGNLANKKSEKEILNDKK